jgi:hypothetical protein
VTTPDVPGLLSAPQAAETAAAIASVQRPDGCIPWEDERHADPWNHVEAAMALDACGLHSQAARAYRWLARAQRADGSWAAGHHDGRVVDAFTDANFCAYPVAGVWHHFLATTDRDFLHEMWPTVEAAVECVLTLQQPQGEVWWARDAEGRPWPGALVSSCSSIYKSLGCAGSAASMVGQARPRWWLARRGLGEALRLRPDAFEPKPRWAMDWYYPVLGGAFQGAAADARLAAGMATFVVEGIGVRCVSDRPWVTVAETCEVVLALQAIGHQTEARRLFGWLAPLRGPGGHYWTGVTFPDVEFWPDERPTWTSAAVLLAADALYQRSRTACFFQHPERADRGSLAELPRGQRPPIDVVRRLAALRRAGEDVVDRQQATGA